MGAVIILVIGGLLAAMLILPRQRELRRHQAVTAALQVGDHVMTGSGLYGTLTALEDDLAWLEIADGVVIKVARRAVAARVDEGGVALDGSPASTAADPTPDEPDSHEPDSHEPASHGSESTEAADPPAPVQPRDIDRRAS